MLYDFTRWLFVAGVSQFPSRVPLWQILGPMTAQFATLPAILKEFPADVILSDCLWREYGLGPEETVNTVAVMLYKKLGDPPRKMKKSRR
jgi:hypothetical protein